MKAAPQTFSMVIANAEKMYLHICKRQAFVLHKRQPLEFLCLTRQEAVTAKWASRVLQFKQQMARGSEELGAGFHVAECPLRAGRGARCSSKVESTPAQALPGRVILGKSHHFSELQVHGL